MAAGNRPREGATEGTADFRLDRTDAGNITANARSGAHDDLVIATGLACLTSSSAGRVVKVSSPYG